MAGVTEFLNTVLLLGSVPEVLKEVVIALAIGGLIGLERENNPERKYAGLRTMTLLGGIAPAVVAASESVGSNVFVYIYLALAAALALTIIYIRLRLEGESIGLTTSVAVFVVAVLGVLVGYNMYLEATSIAIITAILLAEKERMHGYVAKLSQEEIADATKLAALVFVLLPVLPSQPIGPSGVLNLQEVLILVIFVLLVEFAAFFFMRQIGTSKGLQLTGFLGGAASSFATTAVLAKIANKHEKLFNEASSSVVLAILAMIVRNVGIAAAVTFSQIGAVSSSLMSVLGYPALAMAAVAGAIAYFMRGKGGIDDIDVPLTSPFSFKSAAKFAAVFIVISVVSTVAENLFGHLGLYVTAFAGGLVSSAAVATSAASLISSGTTTIYTSSGMVLISIVAAILSKIVVVETVNRDMRRKLILPLLGVAASGLAVFFLL